MGGAGSIQGLMRSAMDSIKEMIDVNTVVGDPVEAQDGSVIIPVSRVSFGFGVGGGEYGQNDQTISVWWRQRRWRHGPTSRFLVVATARSVSVCIGPAILDRLIDITPQLLSVAINAGAGDGSLERSTPLGKARKDSCANKDLPLHHWDGIWPARFSILPSGESRSMWRQVLFLCYRLSADSSGRGAVPLTHRSADQRRQCVSWMKSGLMGTRIAAGAI